MASCLSDSSGTSIIDVDTANPRVKKDEGSEMEEQKKHRIGGGGGGGGRGELVGVGSGHPPQTSEHSQPTCLSVPTKPAVFELDLIGGLAGGGSSDVQVQPPKLAETMEPRVYSCHYCDRKFHSSQALGGHQNAHKNVRAVAKHRQRAAALADHHRRKYTAMPLLENYGRLGGNSVGVMTHSVVHKPPPLPMLYRPHGGGGGAEISNGGQWWAGVGWHLNDGKEELHKLDLSLKL